MEALDNVQQVNIVKQLAEHRDRLTDRLLTALKATFFSNRPSVLPMHLPEIAEEVVNLYLDVVNDRQAMSVARQHGEHLARRGLGNQALQAMGNTLRHHCIELFDASLMNSALEVTEAFTTAILRGFVTGREAIVLEEQERIRGALQAVVNRYTLQMQTAAEIAEATTSILDRETLLNTAVTLIKDRFDLYYVGIFLLDEENRWAVLHAGTGTPGEKMLAQNHRLEVGGESMIGQSVADQQPRIALDVGDAPVHFANPLLPKTRSEMALPLVARGETIGAMTIQSERVAAFSDEDITVLSTMADQMANAIQNAAFFEQVQTNLARTEALYDAGRDLLAQQELDEVLSGIVERLADVLPANRIALLTLDQNAQALERVICGGAGADLWPEFSYETVWQGRYGNALRENRVILWSASDGDGADVEGDAGYMSSQIIVPLQLQGQSVGLLLAVNTSEDPDFSQNDVDLVAAMAAQATAALINMRQFEETHRAYSLLESVINAIPNPIFYKDREGVYQLVNEAFANEVLGLPRERIEGSTVYDLQEAIPSDLADVYHEADMKLIRNPGTQEYEAAVKYADGQRHDVLFNKSTFHNARGEVAGMVGVMLDITARQRAAQELEQRAIQLQTAAELAEAASSVLDIQELLPRMAALIEDRFNLYYVGIFLLDTMGEWALLRAGTGEAGKAMLEAQHRLAVDGQSMISTCLRSKEPQVSLDVDEDALRRFENPYLPETRSEVALPLVSRGETIGAMTIQSQEREAFEEEDIVAFQTMARQLANAIANARLFEQAQTRLEDLQDLQRQVTGEAWTEHVRGKQVLGYTYDRHDLMPLSEPVPQDELERLSHGEVIRQGNGGDGAALIAPLELNDEPIGLLSFEGVEEEEQWQEESVALIDEVRQQLALALENRLLFEQTSQALTETRSLYEMGQQISESNEPEEIFAGVVEGLLERPEVERMMVATLEPAKNPTLVKITHDAGAFSDESWQGREFAFETWEALHTVLREKRQFFTKDVQEDPVFTAPLRRLCRQMGVRGMAAYTLRVREQFLAWVLVYTQDPYEFAPDELRFYETVSRTATVALENLLLLETTREEAERRAFLNEVMTSASSSLDPDDLMQDVGQLIAEHFDMPTMLWRWGGEYATPVAIYHESGASLSIGSANLKLSEMPGVGASIRWKRPILWNFRDRPHVGAVEFDRIIEELDLVEAFTAPLMVRGEVLGLISLGRQEGHPYIDDNERAILRSAAVNIGVALENATLYQQAQETAERLKEVDRLKSEFLANMSHELRTPLNSIIGFSRVILKGIDGPLTDMQKTDLEAIFDSGKHLLNLINDVLDLSKIEAGKMEFVFEPTDLHEVVKGVMSTAIALVKDKPVDLQQDVPDDIPEIVADERRVRQVILNLVGNAAKFTEEGYINVSARHDEEANEVVVAVEDTGIGIPEEKYDSVFQEFRQVDSSSTRRYGGTGLGLPVSKKFVEAHGGRIWFESEVNVGTTFFVALPEDGPPPESGEDEEAETNVGEGRVVMTVDDDEGVITLFRRYLSKQGYQVIGLTRAAEVVEEAKRLQPYAITLDILMPDRDGWEIISDLKSDPETRDIPVIVCSIVSDKDKGLNLGVTDYLVKPILEQDLLDALERVARSPDAQDVMVVDDNPGDRKLLRRVLQGAGYNVNEAPSGTDALFAIQQDPPDLLILDLMMPEMDGFALLENLRANEATRHLPVVVVTAKELTDEERARLNSRVTALLEKGIFDQQRLLGSIASALDNLPDRDRME